MSNANESALALSSTTTNSPSLKFDQLLPSSSSNTSVSSLDYHHHHHNEEKQESYSSSDSEDLASSSSHDSPYTKSPWLKISPVVLQPHNKHRHHHVTLIGSLVREEGHVYSLATSSHRLYTGSDSNNIRVWTKSRLHDSGGFKSSSGLVKSIVVVGPEHKHKIFTGHQDGKIRVWQAPSEDHGHQSTSHTRLGSLPTWQDSLRSRVMVLPIKKKKKSDQVGRHLDAVSCLSLDKEAGLLYSASWDKTIKVWRLKDSKCVDSIKAHYDAVNAVVVAGFGGLVFSGSADGTVKVWKRCEQQLINGYKTIRHLYVETLMEQTSAVTSLAIMRSTGTLYAGTSDGLVSFWECVKLTGTMIYGGVLRGHKLAVLCLATAGSLVLSGSADSTVCVWRREKAGVGGDHACLAVLTGHTGPVKCLAVDQEQDTASGSSSEEEEEDEDDDDVRNVGRRWRVYSGSLDNSVKVWMVNDDPFCRNSSTLRS